MPLRSNEDKMRKEFKSLTKKQMLKKKDQVRVRGQITSITSSDVQIAVHAKTKHPHIPCMQAMDNFPAQLAA